MHAQHVKSVFAAISYVFGQNDGCATNEATKNTATRYRTTSFTTSNITITTDSIAKFRSFSSSYTSSTTTEISARPSNPYNRLTRAVTKSHTISTYPSEFDLLGSIQAIYISNKGLQ